MQSEMAQKALEYAEKLEGIAPQVWEIMVRQQYVEAWAGAAGLFLVSLMVLGLDRWRRSGGISWKGFIRKDASSFAVMITAIALILSLSIFLIESIPRFLNPEYYALMDLIPGK